MAGNQRWHVCVFLLAAVLLQPVTGAFVSFDDTVSAASIPYNSYSVLWVKWKRYCINRRHNKSYSRTEDRKRFGLFTQNARKARVPQTGALSNYAKLPCLAADRTWWEVATDLRNRPLSRVAPAELLAAFWFHWKLRNNICFAGDAEETPVYQAYATIAVNEAWVGGKVSIEDLEKVAWASFFKRRGCSIGYISNTCKA